MYAHGSKTFSTALILLPVFERASLSSSDKTISLPTKHFPSKYHNSTKKTLDQIPIRCLPPLITLVQPRRPSFPLLLRLPAPLHSSAALNPVPPDNTRRCYSGFPTAFCRHKIWCPHCNLLCGSQLVVATEWYVSGWRSGAYFAPNLLQELIRAAQILKELHHRDHELFSANYGEQPLEMAVLRSTTTLFAF